MNPQTGRVDAAGAAGTRSLMLWRALSALLLLVMGAIHLYLVVFSGFAGWLGTLFVVNAVGGLVLAIAILFVGRGLLPLTSAVSFVFLAGTLLGLVISLTVGLFGINEQIDGQLVVTTLVAESIGAIVLAVTTVLAVRARPAATG